MLSVDFLKVKVLYEGYLIFYGHLGWGCYKTNSWKSYLELVRRELDLGKRKKGALDGLFDAGKISQSTYDCLNKDLTEAMARIEADQKTLAERMTTRANELEKQVQTLEMFLANLEIQYAAEEVDEKVYEDQGNAIALGLEVTKRELADIKGALIQLTPGEAAPEAPAGEITIKGMIQKIRMLEEMVMEAAKKKAELEAKVKALEEERACLLAEIEALKAIPELETKVSALETDIVKLKEEKKALEEKPCASPPAEVAPCEAVPAEAPAPAEEKPCEEKPGE